MRIEKDETAGLLIDVQERLIPHIYQYEKLTSQTVRLIEGLKILDIPLIMTQQYTKGLGNTISEITEKTGDTEPIEKNSFSCCDTPEFMTHLASMAKDFIIIAGIEAHVCVMQTAIDAIENGYKTVIIEDCVSSRNVNDKQVAIERMRQEGAIISTVESVLFEMCRHAGNDTFKAISKLVK